MGHQEEIEGAVNYLRLLDEAVVDVGALRRVRDGGVCSTLTNLEESLPDALVDDNKGVLWKCLLFLVIETVLLLHDLVELLQFVVDDLGPHRVTDTVSVNEDVVRQLGGCGRGRPRRHS